MQSVNNVYGINGNYKDRRFVMERIISQMRWPVEVYKAVKERAYRERKSFNAMVVELVVKALG